MELFEEPAAPFQEALKNSGYNHKFIFEEKTTKGKKKRYRKCNNIHFNPPYSAIVETTNKTYDLNEKGH